MDRSQGHIESVSAVQLWHELIELERRVILYLNRHGAKISVREKPNSFQASSKYTESPGRLEYDPLELDKEVRRIQQQSGISPILLAVTRAAKAIPLLFDDLSHDRPTWQFAIAMAKAMSEFPKESTGLRVKAHFGRRMGGNSTASRRQRATATVEDRIRGYVAEFKKGGRPRHDWVGVIQTRLKAAQISMSDRHVRRIIASIGA